MPIHILPLARSRARPPPGINSIARARIGGGGGREIEMKCIEGALKREELMSTPRRNVKEKEWDEGERPEEVRVDNGGVQLGGMERRREGGRERRGSQ